MNSPQQASPQQQKPQPTQPAVSPPPTANARRPQNNNQRKPASNTNSSATKQNPLMQHVGNMSAPHPAVRDTITAANATLASGAICYAGEIPWYWPSATGVVLGVSGAVLGNRHGQSGFGASVGASAGGWVAWSAATTPWDLAHLASLAIASVGYGVWYRVARRKAKQLHAVQRQNAAAQANAQVDPNSAVNASVASVAEIQAAQGAWQAILDSATGEKGVQVVETRSLEGAPGVRIVGNLTDPKFDFRALEGSIGSIELTADRRTPHPIRPGSVQLNRPKGATASQFELTVPTSNIFGQKIPHPIDYSLKSIEDPFEVATSADGRRIDVKHADSPHAMFSGMTDMGKSMLLNVHIFNWMRCYDAAPWIISGSDKSARLFKPLLRAWLKGEAERPPIDRFAATEEEAMRVLWDARRAIEVRGRGGGIDDLDEKWKVTADSPRIPLAVEEAGDFLASDVKHMMPDGKKWTFGKLFLEVIRKARSEAINLLILTQGGTMDITGDHGSAIKKQILYRVAFRAQTHTETNAVLSGNTSRVELGELDRGEIYIERAGDPRPILALGDYFTAEDMDAAARALCHNSHEVDEKTASAMPFYADRWTRQCQQDYLRQLLGGHVPAHDSQDSGESAGRAQSGGVLSVGGSDSDDADQDMDPSKAADDLEQSMKDIEAKYAREVEELERQREVQALEEAFQSSPDESSAPRNLGDLSAAALRIVGVLRDIEGSAITAEDLAQAVADRLGVEATSDLDRQINAAVREIIGVPEGAELPNEIKGRRTIGGAKRTAWDMAAIRDQINRLGDGQG